MLKILKNQTCSQSFFLQNQISHEFIFSFLKEQKLYYTVFLNMTKCVTSFNVAWQSKQLDKICGLQVVETSNNFYDVYHTDECKESSNLMLKISLKKLKTPRMKSCTTSRFFKASSTKS